MTRVHPYLLWLGHAGDGTDIRAITDAGIEAVLQLAIEEPPLRLPRELIYFRVPILDGASNNHETLRLAADLAVRVLKQQVPTLICCSAGASRSPAIAACAISIVENKSPAECLDLVHGYHSTDVSPGL